MLMVAPVSQVERKIKRKGSPVPKKLSNILKLFSIPFPQRGRGREGRVSFY
jgi:hypothetical protein